MTKRIEVRNQEECDACVQAGNIAIVIGFRAVLWDNASAELWGNASAELWDNASAVLWGNASAELWGNASAELWDNASAELRDNTSAVLRGNASAVLWDNASAELWDNASAELRDNTSAVLRDNTSAELRDNTSAEAFGNAFLRIFSALKVKASAHVSIVVHGPARSIEGGRQMEAAPKPRTGAEYCEFNGIDPATAPYVVPNIDAAILAALESEKAQGLDMSDWHGRNCNETNWCETTHCRAGFAICLAGKAGFDLERKHGAEIAGRMIYAVSRPDMPLPDFFAGDEDALEDIKACAGRTV